MKFGFPYSPTACLRPHNLVHVPTPAYAPKGNAYIHNDQCQPPDKSFCLSKNLCSLALLSDSAKRSITVNQLKQLKLLKLWQSKFLDSGSLQFPHVPLKNWLIFLYSRFSDHRLVVAKSSSIQASRQWNTYKNARETKMVLAVKEHSTKDQNFSAQRSAANFSWQDAARTESNMWTCTLFYAIFMLTICLICGNPKGSAHPTPLAFLLGSSSLASLAVGRLRQSIRSHQTPGVWPNHGSRTSWNLHPCFAEELRLETSWCGKKQSVLPNRKNAVWITICRTAALEGIVASGALTLGLRTKSSTFSSTKSRQWQKLSWAKWSGMYVRISKMARVCIVQWQSICITHNIHALSYRYNNIHRSHGV